MIIYLISVILICFGIFQKIFFLKLEGLYSLGWMGLAALGIAVLLTILGIIIYKKDSSKKIFNKTSSMRVFILLMITISTILIFSFILNLIGHTFNWDSVALYDARARFLLGGTKFSDMTALSAYDPKNIYYYLLYPPYTSLVHYFWYKLSLPFPVGLYYTVCLILFAVSIYFLTCKKIGKIPALLLVFLTVVNNVVFFSSLIAYTNLPYSLLIVLGVFLLFDYLQDNISWKLYFGILLIVGSIWIRYLEPLWFGIIVAFSISIALKKGVKKSLLLSIPFLIFGTLEYFSWKYFVDKNLGSNQVVSFESTKILEPIIGIFTGSLVTILIFFFKSWGVMVLVHFSGIAASLKYWRKNLFLILVILFSGMIYFGGLYFVSFQSEWWDKLGDSLIRSSAFMIPISGYLIIEYLIKGKRYEKSD